MSFTVPVLHGYNAIQDNFDSGNIGARRKWKGVKRHFTWNGTVLREDEVMPVMGFITERGGGAEFFYMDNLMAPIFPPFGAPTLTGTGGGTLPGRTRYVRFTWSDGTNETTPSQIASFTLLANNWLEVTVPQFPRGVAQANVYVGSVSGQETLVGKITSSGGTWTEFNTFVDTDSGVGTDILFVDDTSGFALDEYIDIDKAASGGGFETHQILAILAAPDRLQLYANLANTHTAVQGDIVQHAVGSGPALPTANTLFEEIRVILKRDPVLIRVTPQTWALTLELVEVF